MARLRETLDTAVTALVATVALAMGAAFIKDRFLDRARNRGPELAAPRLVKTWKADNAQGILVGSAAAPVVITEFMDFECPFCAELVNRLDTLITRYPNKIAIVVQHFPLPFHKFALPAAIASECADRQGRFVTMYRTLYARQDSFGLAPWKQYAKEAGVPDLRAFDQCIKLPKDSFPRISAGMALATREMVRGTPTIWINGLSIGRSDLIALTAHTEKVLNETR